jgi:hypothetical protein
MNSVPIEQRRGPWRWWRVVTSLIALAVLMEAVFAGAMLSGVGWARTAHAVNATIVIASAFIAGLICVATLRGIATPPLELPRLIEILQWNVFNPRDSYLSGAWRIPGHTNPPTLR